MKFAFNDDIPKEVKAIKDPIGTMITFDDKENLRKSPSSSTVRNSSSSFYVSQSSPSESPDIESVIKGFEQELDTLSRNFDILASSQSQSKLTRSSNEYYPLCARRNNRATGCRGGGGGGGGAADDD